MGLFFFHLHKGGRGSILLSFPSAKSDAAQHNGELRLAGIAI